jgi:hypothetical protein
VKVGICIFLLIKTHPIPMCNQVWEQVLINVSGCRHCHTPPPHDSTNRAPPCQAWFEALYVHHYILLLVIIAFLHSLPSFAFLSHCGPIGQWLMILEAWKMQNFLFLTRWHWVDFGKEPELSWVLLLCPYSPWLLPITWEWHLKTGGQCCCWTWGDF